MRVLQERGDSAIPRDIKQEYMTFGDNRLLPQLFGEQNSHLTDIENAFDVKIHGRGNEVTITGRDSDTQRAKDILSILWNKLQQGDEVDDQTVDAALRFSMADKETKMPHPKTTISRILSRRGARLRSAGKPSRRVRRCRLPILK